MFVNILRMQPILHFIIVIGLLMTLTSKTNCLGDNRSILHYNYDRQTLIDLRSSPTVIQSSLLLKDIDLEHPESPKSTRSRKRGKKGGVRARNRQRKFRVPVPSLMIGNVRSIRNKTDELAANARFNYEYRESSMICLTETWLNENDSNMDIDGYTLIRSDRTEAAGKESGGGVCTYVNDRWCNNITVKKKYCDKNIEYLSMSLRPFYLPREINNVFCITVYIPPEANKNIAINILHDHINDIENSSPDAIKIINGDFNHASLDKMLPNYEQVVKCKTREENVLDLVYCNYKDSYKAIQKPALGDSDHNMVQLLPTYRQKLKTAKPTISKVKVWSTEAIDNLRSQFDTTDWDILCNATNIDDNVNILTEYINFCTENSIPVKEIKSYPNNKPWVTKELKSLLNKKKQALAVKDKEKLKVIQSELKKAIFKCKLDYKNKMEDLFRSNDTKQAWKSLKTLCGYTKKSTTMQADDDKIFADELNYFYARFDDQDFSEEKKRLVEILENKGDEKIIISESEVDKHLGKIKPNKAAGPDNMCGKVLKECRKQLAPILTKIFQISLDRHIIPSLWLTSELIPVPKINLPKVKNDLRPVALTAIVMKTFERVTLGHLKPDIKLHKDPLQFAYSEDLGVDDAVLTLSHVLHSHLDTLKTHARVLFVDFSSAFNTIQPHILMKKLMDMGVNSNLILWIHEFLSNRPQYVKFNGIKSKVIVINTGAPQGCVLSAILFTIYTSDCRSSSEHTIIIKYADDTVIIGLISKDDDSKYKEEVENFTKWCDDNFLNLNVTKTKEMIIDFRTGSKQPTEPLIIMNENVKIVSRYTYLGSVIDDKLKGSENVSKVYKKANQRLYFLRKLKNVHVDNLILTLFYKSIIESVLSFCLSCWYGYISVSDKKKLNKIVKCAKRLGCIDITDLNVLYKNTMLCKMSKIMKNVNHPLNMYFKMLPSEKRMSSIYSRTCRYGNTFVLSAIRHYNDDIFICC